MTKRRTMRYHYTGTEWLRVAKVLGRWNMSLKERAEAIGTAFLAEPSGAAQNAAIREQQRKLREFENAASVFLDAFDALYERDPVSDAVESLGYWAGKEARFLEENNILPNRRAPDRETFVFRLCALWIHGAGRPLTTATKAVVVNDNGLMTSKPYGPALEFLMFASEPLLVAKGQEPLTPNSARHYARQFKGLETQRFSVRGTNRHTLRRNRRGMAGMLKNSE